MKQLCTLMYLKSCDEEILQAVVADNHKRRRDLCGGEQNTAELDVVAKKVCKLHGSQGAPVWQVDTVEPRTGRTGSSADDDESALGRVALAHHVSASQDRQHTASLLLVDLHSLCETVLHGTDKTDREEPYQFCKMTTHRI